MAEDWLEVKVYFRNPDLPKKVMGTDDPDFLPAYRRVLLELLKPLLTFAQKTVTTYHFFFEPDPHVLVRLKLSARTDSGPLKHEVTRLASGMMDLLSRVDFNEGYTGEAIQYGTDGWRVAQDLFRVAAEIALLRVDGAAQKGTLFNLGKLIHCICNPVMGTQSAEMQFYHQRLMEMFGIALSTKVEGTPFLLIPQR